MSIAKDGLSWLFPIFLITIFFIFLVFYTIGIVKYLAFFFSLLSFLTFLILLLFFRDPQRRIGDGVVAVADGVIRDIVNGDDEDVGSCIKISTFMNIHNVHVNRMPMDGVIKDIIHCNGAHIPAFKKESEKNERVTILIKTGIGIVKIIQIAGTIARRIVPYVKKGDMVKKGEKIGIIRLGSRVDVYLPAKKIKSINVKTRYRIKAGEDTIAEMYD